MFQQRQLERNKQEIADRVMNSERKMAELRQAADSIKVRDIHTNKYFLYLSVNVFIIFKY